MSLADRQEKSWQFFEEEVEEMPSPYAEKQDFDFSSLDEKGLEAGGCAGISDHAGLGISKITGNIITGERLRFRRILPGRQLWLRFEGGIQQQPCVGEWQISLHPYRRLRLPLTVILALSPGRKRSLWW